MTDDLYTRLTAALADRYAIERPVGEGGMATVYLAQDLKHHRKVALKVLKPELAAVVGAERFLAEIETTAGLNHPNILPLFDSGEAAGSLFYVMPYVEGESLRERIASEKQLPLAEAVQVATDVAGAMDYAHRHGVVHRDIKPANVLLQDGRPMVADFGIALAVSQAGGGRLTETGLSIGTPYYMSPEQATGDRDVDARSDIYALGCVLYEMLTGEPPYGGTTAQAVLGRILVGSLEPPTTHRKSIPANVEDAVLRALEKLPADRFGTAAEMASALQDPGFRHRDPAGVGAADRRTGRSASLMLTTAVALAALAVGWLLRGGAGSTEIERQRIALGSGPEHVVEAVAFRTALHPHGEGILFPDTLIVNGRASVTLWWKADDELDPVPIPSMVGAISPTFSPDGESVAFVQNSELKRQRLAGGSAVTLVRNISGGTAHALAWLDDGTIVYENTGYVIQSIDETGTGPSDTLSTEVETGQPIHMSAIPGTRLVLVSACVNSCPSGTMLSVLDLDGPRVTHLTDQAVRAWPGPDARIIYLTRSGQLLAAELDHSTLELGPPTPLLEGARVSGDANGDMHLAPDGTLLYVRGAAGAGDFILAWVDRSGRSQRLAGGAYPPREYATVALAPDGRRIALGIQADGGPQIWIADVDGGPMVPLTSNEVGANRPVWYPNGERVAYVSLEGRRHIRSARADGTSLRRDTLWVGRPGFSPYEVALVGSSDSIIVRIGGTQGDIYLVSPPDGETTELVAGAFFERNPILSPDGRWLAFASSLSGRYEIYVRPFPDIGAGQFAISTEGGSEPVWSSDGESMYYRDATGWMVESRLRATDDEVSVTSRERLFDASGYQRAGGTRAYDVAPDGSRFLMLEPGPGVVRSTGDLIRVENFFELLERGGGP